MVWEVVQVLEVAFFEGRPDQGEAISVFVVFGQRSPYFFGALVDFDFAVLLEEDVLEILRRRERVASFIDHFEGEVSEDPHEFGHVPKQVLLVAVQIGMFFQNYVLGELRDDVQL